MEVTVPLCFACSFLSYSRHMRLFSRSFSAATCAFLAAFFAMSFRLPSLSRHPIVGIAALAPVLATTMDERTYQSMYQSAEKAENEQETQWPGESMAFESRSTRVRYWHYLIAMRPVQTLLDGGMNERCWRLLATENT